MNLLINIMNPKYYFPVKGEYRNQYANAEVAESLGIPKENIILKQNGDVEKLLHGSWSHMEAFDEDEWLEHLEEHLKEIVNISGKDERTLAARFEEHRREIHERIMKEHPELAQRFKERRHRLDEHLKERRPEVYDLVVSLRELEKRKDME